MNKNRAALRSLGALLTVSAICVSPRAFAQVDVMDQFFRNSQVDHPQFVDAISEGQIDLFSGVLHIGQTDLTLPGRGGLDLRLTRSYSSAIWARSDVGDLNSLIPEAEHSVLGYGWSLHLGRLKNPGASGAPTSACSSDYPVLETPDGQARQFFRVSATTPDLLVSQDYWRMEANCSAMGGNGKGTCVWSSDGIRYEFSPLNVYLFGSSGPSMWPVTRIVDRYGNQISVSYVAASYGAINSITDTYGRTVAFSYVADVDGLRLSTISAGARSIQFGYTTYSTPAGPRRFLTSVTPPAGRGSQFTYSVTGSPATNQLALATMAYPGGGTVTYTYSTASFYLGGGATLPRAVVSQRSLAGADSSAQGSWSFTYQSDGSGSMSTTSVVRPDGYRDVYAIYGFGAVGAGSVWKVGRLQQVQRSILNGQTAMEVETRTWSTGADAIASSILSPPGYATCGTSTPADVAVYAPVLTQRSIVRDGATYLVTYSDFDGYGQPKSVVETGQGSRTTTWTYFHAPAENGATLNLVRGLPATQHICVGGDCVDSSWTYNGPHFSRDSETRSGVTKKATYDQFGNLESETNAIGSVIKYSGYADGNGVATTTDHNGAYRTARTCSWEGWVLSETNGRGFVTAYEYDSAGRITRKMPPGNDAPTTYSYSPDGLSVTETKGAGWRRTTTDGFGRAVATLDSEGVQTVISYDAMGRVVFKSYANDSDHVLAGELFSYDGLGRVIVVARGYQPALGKCDAVGACLVTHSYLNNCVTTATERSTGDAPTTTTCNTSFGSPDEQYATVATDANGYAWTTTHDAAGGATSLKAPLAAGNWTHSYDPTTRFLNASVDGQTGKTTFTRDAIGDVLTRTDASGAITRYARADPLGRVTGISYEDAGGTASGDSVTIGYDESGNVVSRSTPNGGTFVYTYDESSRVTKLVWTAPGGKAFTTTYEYDASGCLSKLVYPTGTTMTMACDTRNRPVAVSMSGNSVVSGVRYHPSGQVSAMTGGNGVVSGMEFDARGRPATIVARGSTDILGLSYSYDGDGNVVVYDNSAVAGSGRSMKYNPLGRLITSVAPNLWGTAVYDYDAVGNITLNSVGSYSIQYTYDSATGLLASVRGGKSKPAAMSLTWNAAGRLVSLSDGTTYKYDGTGRRVLIASGGGSVLYHYDALGRMISETTQDGTKLRDYIYLGDRLIAVDGCIEGAAQQCSQREWYHQDKSGSVLARTDSSGKVTARMEYLPTGEQWTASGVVDDRQYRGLVVDSSGLQLVGKKVYWTSLGTVVGGRAAKLRGVRRGRAITASEVALLEHNSGIERLAAGSGWAGDLGRSDAGFGVGEDYSLMGTDRVVAAADIDWWHVYHKAGCSIVGGGVGAVCGGAIGWSGVGAGVCVGAGAATIEGCTQAMDKYGGPLPEPPPEEVRPIDEPAPNEDDGGELRGPVDDPDRAGPDDPWSDTGDAIAMEGEGEARSEEGMVSSSDEGGGGGASKYLTDLNED